MGSIIFIGRTGCERLHGASLVATEKREMSFSKLACRTVLAFAITLLIPAKIWASNCGSKHDCWNTAGAAAAAAAGAGAAAAAGARRKKKSAPPVKPDPCAGYQRGYDQEKAILDTIDAQRQSKADAYNKALPQLAQLLDQFNNAAPEALATVKEFQHLQIVLAFTNLVAELAVEVIAPELGIAEAIEGQPTALFHALETVIEISEMDATSRTGSLELMREWALNNLSNFPDDLAKVLNLVNLGERMKELADYMKGLKNQYDGMQDEVDTQAQKVADAKAALDACRASQG